MSKIKYIHCLGSSFTAGGGFEWETLYEKRTQPLHEFYGHLDEEKTQYNYSWPGQLQKLNPALEVINHAESGYGNDRVYRILYDIVTKHGFNKKEHLFLIEFSGLGSKEFFLNDINDFIVTNYGYDNKKINHVDLAKSYFNDISPSKEKVQDNRNVFENFLKKTFNEEKESKDLEKNISFILSWLKQNELNTVITSKPPFLHKIDDDLYNSFNQITYSIKSKKYYEISDFIYNEKLTISDETNGFIKDNHPGFETNQLIATIINNYLVENKIIDGYKKQNEKLSKYGRLKYIHCFGTSYTAGGGYEFGTSREFIKDLVSIYEDSGEELSRYNFSYPGQLKKLINSKGIDLKVQNHAESGAGNEMMYRKFFEIVKNPKFKKEEHLFLFEFSHLGRKEYYSNELNDYIVLNYKKINKEDIDVSVGKKYFYDTDRDKKVLNNIDEISRKFLNETINEEEQTFQLEMYASYFSNFLMNNEFNYYYTQPPWANLDTYRHDIINFYFKDTNTRKENVKFNYDEKDNWPNEGFVSFFHDYELQIFKETNGRVEDGHMSLWGSKIVSSQIFNTLIDDNYIKSEKVDYILKIRK